MIVRTWIFLALHFFAAIALDLAPRDRYGTVPGLENCETKKKGQFDAACMDRNAKHILSYVKTAPPLPREQLVAGVPLICLALAGAFFVFSSALKSRRLTTFVTALAIYILLGAVGVFGPAEVAIVLGIATFLLVRSRAASAQGDVGEKQDRNES